MQLAEATGNGGQVDNEALGVTAGNIFEEVDSRITIESGRRSGQPCIRSLRITVWDVLSWLAEGMTEKEILEDYPELELADFAAVYDIAARLGNASPCKDKLKLKCFPATFESNTSNLSCEAAAGRESIS